MNQNNNNLNNIFKSGMFTSTPQKETTPSPFGTSNSTHPNPFGGQQPFGSQNVFQGSTGPSFGQTSFFTPSKPQGSVFGALGPSGTVQPVTPQSNTFGTQSTTGWGTSPFGSTNPTPTPSYGSGFPGGSLSIGSLKNGTRDTPYQDTRVKDGIGTVEIKHINAMNEYTRKSNDELRQEDYNLGRKAITSGINSSMGFTPSSGMNTTGNTLSTGNPLSTGNTLSTPSFTTGLNSNLGISSNTGMSTNQGVSSNTGMNTNGFGSIFSKPSTVQPSTVQSTTPSLFGIPSSIPPSTPTTPSFPSPFQTGTSLFGSQSTASTPQQNVPSSTGVNSTGQSFPSNQSLTNNQSLATGQSLTTGQSFPSNQSLATGNQFFPGTTPSFPSTATQSFPTSQNPFNSQSVQQASIPNLTSFSNTSFSNTSFTNPSPLNNTFQSQPSLINYEDPFLLQDMTFERVEKKSTPINRVVPKPIFSETVKKPLINLKYRPPRLNQKKKIYTEPSAEEARHLKEVDNLVVGFDGKGRIQFIDKVSGSEVTTTNIEDKITFLKNEVVVSDPPGVGLNKRARVYVEGVFAFSKSQGDFIVGKAEKLPLKAIQERFVYGLKEDPFKKFIDYNYETGLYVYEVNHF